MAFPPSRFTAGLASAALAVLAAPAAHAYDFPCFSDDMVESARIHDLRVMLMVSALKCRFDNPQTLRDYTGLLDNREDEFSFHGQKVRENMMARYGAARGNSEFQSYNTRLSNYHSQLQPTRELCEDSSAFMRLAQRADNAELATLSALATNRAVRTCPVEATRASARFVPPARENEPVASEAGWSDEPAWDEPAAEMSTPEMVDGVPTYTAPGSLPETEPEPLETVDVPSQVDMAQIAQAEAAASEAAASGDDAKVDQAIAALSAAVEALKGLKTAP